ncbi:hypothetical protein [Peribacillus sp. JNUCC41]|uniref:hypothetical protein n=1 Tax=Peribacillus sp. JNUCC41 TaxID=2778370 RepID=UPI00177D58BE|nr:hypothetical protein [Brevibacillus sp. JNUCC-41]QOS90233.1 hypothetical protein JNUCC41_00105 [Brevibacillus sp. JNUCC-41]
MNILKLKEVEDLKVELEKIKEINNVIYGENVVPVLKDKAVELLLKIDQYFQDIGFATKIKSNKLTATYNTLTFTAEIREQQFGGNIISIMKGDEEIDTIRVVIKTTGNGGFFAIPEDKVEAEIVKLKKDIGHAKSITKNYENPVYHYGRSNNNQISYTDIDSLLKDVFQ